MLEYMQDGSEEIFRGYGTFIFPPKWIGKNIVFPKVILSPDWKKLEPLFKHYTEIVYETDYNGVNILICRDGFIGICGIEKGSDGGYFELKWQKIFDDILQVIMASGLLLEKEMFSVRPNDLFQFIKELDDKKLTVVTIGRKYPSHGLRDSLYFERFGGAHSPIFKMQSSHRELITIDEIGKIITVSKKYFGKIEIKDDLATILEAYTHYFYNEFNQSFTLSWNIIEAWINEKWNRLIDASGIPLSTKKIKDLKDSITWYASHKSLALFLSKQINDDDYKTMHQLRQKRNDFLHRGKKIKSEDALKCFEFAKKIIKNKLKV